MACFGVVTGAVRLRRPPTEPRQKTARQFSAGLCRFTNPFYFMQNGIRPAIDRAPFLLFPPPTQQSAALWSGRGERDSEHRVTAPHSHTPGAASPTNPPQPSNNHHHNTPNARNIHTHPPLPIDGVTADHVDRRKRCLFLCHAPPPWVDGRISPVEIASIYAPLGEER